MIPPTFTNYYPSFSNLFYFANSVFRKTVFTTKRPELIVWYKKKWRKLLNFIPPETIQNKGEFIFEGLTKPRTIHAGVKFFIIFNSSLVQQDLQAKQFWFQPNGPQLPDLIESNWYLKSHYHLNPKIYIESIPPVDPHQDYWDDYRYDYGNED